MKANTEIKGSCLCGAIKLHIDSLDRDVIICHCQQCRKQTGHVVAATRALDSKLTVIDRRIDGEECLTWYEASENAKRGFCKQCGSLLFWKLNGTEHTSIMAGCLESPTHLKTISHIYTEDKGDYYDLNDNIPTFKQSSFEVSE